MAKQVFKKGDKYFCKECKSHILTFSQDVFIGMALSEVLIDQSEGQAPWKAYDRCNCKNCNRDWYEDLLRSK